MVRDTRIKNYIFLEASGNNVGSTITQYTDHVINGELLRVDTFGNYTGSLIVKQSGLNVPFLNATVTSGPSNWQSFYFTNNTGSFVTNSILQAIVSGLSSGTAIKAGPFEIIYR